MSLPELYRLREAGLPGELDLQFAALMCRLAQTESRDLALGAALASNWSVAGHVCLELEQVAGCALVQEHPDLSPPSWRIGSRPSARARWWVPRETIGR
jgi:hypothetical protein